MIDKIDDINVLSKQKIIKRKQFLMRRASKAIITPLAITLAKACAEDANTAYYVKDYNKGNFSSREDYIEYMADKFQYIINGGKI